MNNYFKLSIFMLSVCTYGCTTSYTGIAAATFTTHEKEFDSFKLGKAKYQILKNNGHGVDITKQQLIESWGKPSYEKTYGSCDAVVYADGLSWSGIGLYIVALPVPLLVPSGIDETIVYFKNNKAVLASQEFGKFNKYYGFICKSTDCNVNYTPNIKKVKSLKETNCFL